LTLSQNLAAAQLRVATAKEACIEVSDSVSVIVQLSLVLRKASCHLRIYWVQ
jgi:hypothetical protein